MKDHLLLNDNKGKIPIEFSDGRFVGRTIVAIDATFYNNIIFTFQDGGRVALHIEALSCGLPERATGDETARHISRLLDHLTREKERADAAEAEAKDAMLANAALREALKEVLSWHDYTDDMHKPVEVRAAYMRARATLAQSRSDSECDLPAADGGAT